MSGYTAFNTVQKSIPSRWSSMSKSIFHVLESYKTYHCQCWTIERSSRHLTSVTRTRLSRASTSTNFDADSTLACNRLPHSTTRSANDSNSVSKNYVFLSAQLYSTELINVTNRFWWKVTNEIKSDIAQKGNKKILLEIRILLWIRTVFVLWQHHAKV